MNLFSIFKRLFSSRNFQNLFPSHKSLVTNHYSQRGLAPLVIIIAIALIAAAVPTTVILVQQEQDNRQEASESIERCTSNSRNDIPKLLSQNPEETFKILAENELYGDIDFKDLRNSGLAATADGVTKVSSDLQSAANLSAALPVGVISHTGSGKILVTSVNGLIAEASSIEQAQEILRQETLKNPFYRDFPADGQAMSKVKTLISGQKYQDAAKMLDDYAGQMGKTRTELINHLNKIKISSISGIGTGTDIGPWEVWRQNGTKLVFQNKSEFIKYVDETTAVLTKAKAIVTGTLTVEETALTVLTQTKGLRYAKLYKITKLSVTTLGWSMLFEILFIGGTAQSTYLGCMPDGSKHLYLTYYKEEGKWNLTNPQLNPEGTICKYKGSSCIEFVSGTPPTATPAQGPIQDPRDTCFDPTGGGLQFKCSRTNPGVGWTQSRDKTCAEGTGICYWYAPPSTRKSCAETYQGSNASCIQDIKCKKTIYDSKDTTCEDQPDGWICCGDAGAKKVESPSEPPVQPKTGDINNPNLPKCLPPFCTSTTPPGGDGGGGVQPTPTPIPPPPTTKGFCADGNRQYDKPVNTPSCVINNTVYRQQFDSYCHHTYNSPRDFFYECLAANAPTTASGYCANATATSNPISINNPTCGLANASYDSNYDDFCEGNYGSKDSQSHYFYKCPAITTTPPPTTPTATPTSQPPQGPGAPVQQDTAVSCLGENPQALTFTKNGLSESLQDRNCTDSKVSSSSSRCCKSTSQCINKFGDGFTCKTLQNDRGGPFGNCSTLPLCNN